MTQAAVTHRYNLVYFIISFHEENGHKGLLSAVMPLVLLFDSLVYCFRSMVNKLYSVLVSVAC